MVLAKSSDNTVNNNLMILSTEINRLNNQISNINSVQIPDVDKEIERESDNYKDREGVCVWMHLRVYFVCTFVWKGNLVYVLDVF